MHSPLSAEIIFSSHTIRNKACQLEMKVHQIKLISLQSEKTIVNLSNPGCPKPKLKSASYEKLND